MNCPNCQNTMINKKKDYVEIDFCESCNGLWLDLYEYDDVKKVLKIETKTEEPYFVPSIRTNENSKKCPICDRIMEKLQIGQGILLDRCPAQHGVWFDKGELSKFLNENIEELFN